MLRTLVSAAAAASLLALAPAFGADLRVAKAPIVAPVPVWNWSGFYIGGHVGGGIGDADVALFPGAGWTINGSPTAAPWLIDNGSPKLRSSGALGGVQAGFNVQNANWVWGVEADISATGISASRNTGVLVPPPVTTLADRSLHERDELRWLATFRGRLGYAAQQWLLYITGGAAVGERAFSQNILVEPQPGFNNNRGATSTTRVGWTAGAGFEYLLSRNWSVKGEYLYVDLGKVSVFSDSDTAPGFGLTINTSSHLTLHTARVGLNYKFDWAQPVVAKY